MWGLLGTCRKTKPPIAYHETKNDVVESLRTRVDSK